jgi:hypothetical protein
MKEIQYLDIILVGLLKNELLLKSYLIRKQKEAANINFVSDIEFVQKCIDTVSFLENNIETQFLEKKTELYQTVESLKSKNKPFEKELQLAQSFSLERFNINLSALTKGKYKDDLWFSQIKFIKKCIVEINNQNFITTIEIKDLDIDNYLNFVFAFKSINRESKKNAVLKSIEKSKVEKTISNYRIRNDYVFNQQNYWEEVTEEERELFDKLRMKSMEEMKSSYENFIKGSPKPRITLEKEFEVAVFDRLSKEPYQETTINLINAILPKDLNKLAVVIGKIDFIKTLNNVKAPQKLESPEIYDLTLSEIALKCYYEGKILNRENSKDELVGTNYSSSEKLYAHFTRWSNKTDRKAPPESKKKLMNKITTFENVIESLSETNRSIALKELSTLKEHLTTMY